MQNSIILDEYWTFGNNTSSSSARGQVARPTFALSVQDLLDNPNINAWKPKKLKANHNNKALKAMQTKYLISLRNEFGQFTMENGLARFKKYNTIIPNSFYEEMLNKKRIFKNR
jgi:hypothetical protein